MCQEDDEAVGRKVTGEHAMQAICSSSPSPFLETSTAQLARRRWLTLTLRLRLCVFALLMAMAQLGMKSFFIAPNRP